MLSHNSRRRWVDRVASPAEGKETSSLRAPCIRVTPRHPNMVERALTALVANNSNKRNTLTKLLLSLSTILELMKSKGKSSSKRFHTPAQPVLQTRALPPSGLNLCLLLSAMRSPNRSLPSRTERPSTTVI